MWVRGPQKFVMSDNTRAKMWGSLKPILKWLKLSACFLCFSSFWWIFLISQFALAPVGETKTPQSPDIFCFGCWFLFIICPKTYRHINTHIHTLYHPLLHACRSTRTHQLGLIILSSFPSLFLCSSDTVPFSSGRVFSTLYDIGFIKLTGKCGELERKHPEFTGFDSCSFPGGVDELWFSNLSVSFTLRLPQSHHQHINRTYILPSFSSPRFSECVMRIIRDILHLNKPQHWATFYHFMIVSLFYGSSASFTLSWGDVFNF